MLCRGSRETAEAEKLRKLEVSNKAQYKSELDRQARERQISLAESKRTERDEFNRMKGLPVGNYHPDHGDLPSDWDRAVNNKRRTAASERKHKAQERIDIDKRANIYMAENNQFDSRKQDLELKAKYRSELANQIDIDRALKLGESRGAVGLQIGQDRDLDKEAYKHDLDHQVASKKITKQVIGAKSRKEDLERLQRISGMPIKDELGEQKQMRADYRNQLDAQNEVTRDLKESQRMREEAEARASQGLPIGNYNPNYKEYLDKELRRQIQEKEEVRQRQRDEKHTKDTEYLSKIQRAKDAALADIQYQPGSNFNQDLNDQIAGNRRLRDQEKQRAIEEERAATGLPLGLYRPDYRDELKRGLDGQVAEKRERQASSKRETLQQERDRLARISGIPQPDIESMNKQQAFEYKVQLDSQVEHRSNIRNLQKELQLLEDQNNTGLRIGDYKPYDREALKLDLLYQIDQKKQACRHDKEKTRELERERLNIIKEMEGGMPDYNQVAAEQNSKFTSGLNEQITSNADYRSRARQRDQDEERAATGLPLGLYRPDYRDELKRGLDGQVAEKRERQEREVSQRREYERNLLRQLEEARQRNDPADALRIEKELKKDYYGELTDQAAFNARVKSELARREKDELRASTGLPLGLYNPDFRDELKHGLDQQVLEKRLKDSQSRQNNLETELEHLEMQRRCMEAQGEPSSNRWDDRLIQDLKAQMQTDEYKKIQEKNYQKSGDLGLKIGDYKGYDKDALIRALQQQISQKQDLARSMKSHEAQREAQELQKRLDAFRQLPDYQKLDRDDKMSYKRMLDGQRGAERNIKDADRARNLAEDRNNTGLPLGMYNPDYRDELKQGLLEQIEQKQSHQRDEKHNELNQEIERLRLITEAGWDNTNSVSEEQYYRELQEQVANNQARAQVAKREELEEIAKSVGLNLGNYQGYDKDEFRHYLAKQISEKEDQLRGSKVN